MNNNQFMLKILENNIRMQNVLALISRNIKEKLLLKHLKSHFIYKEHRWVINL